jgi:pyruvate/2-oxoglutarate dehydrogenase complex dihydrolipoamide acyltransferase (E2) component
MSAMSNPEVARSDLPLYNVRALRPLSRSTRMPPCSRFSQNQAGAPPQAEVMRPSEIASVHSSHSASDAKESYAAKPQQQADAEAYPADSTSADSDAAAALYARENGLDVDVPKTGGIGHMISKAVHSRWAIYVRDFGMVALIFAWWLPGIINDDPRVRGKRVPNSILAWFFIL